MKLSLSFGQLITAANLVGKTIEEAIEYFFDLGVKSMDFSLGSIQAREISYSYVKNLYRKYDLYCDSVCEEIKFNNKSRDELRELSKIYLEKCAELNSPVFMPVPEIKVSTDKKEERLEQLKRVTQYLCDTAEISKKYGVITAIENYSDTRVPISYVSDISYILQNAPMVKYVFDTGNFWFGGSDMRDACISFADKTVYVHLKDLRENSSGYLKISGRCADSVPIGNGNLPVYETVNILKSFGYTGAYQIEINHADTNLFSDVETSILNLKANI